MYDYSKLKGRIVEKFGSQKRFAEALGVAESTVSGKMTGKTDLSREDIETWSNVLDIEAVDYGVYFFTRAL